MTLSLVDLEVENIPHARRTPHAEDMPRFDENRGTDRIADTSRAHIVGGYKARRAQRKDCSFRRQEMRVIREIQGRAD